MRLTPTALLLLSLGLTAYAPRHVADMSGEWIARVSGATGTMASTLVLTQDGERLRGEHLSNTGTRRALAGRAVGDSVAFAYAFREDVIIQYRGVVVTPDSLAGAVEYPGRPTANFTAARRR